MTDTPGHASPVRTTVRLLASGRRHARATVAIDLGEPALIGHYPGFAIFPGVCVLEYLHRSFLAAGFIDGNVELRKIKAVRFIAPVFPGDVLTIDVEVWREGEQWVCVATADTDRGPVASADLRYETGAGK
jgi:3-hydroxyacyl-[acyl-carrier-protein] dehydratase